MVEEEVLIQSREMWIREKDYASLKKQDKIRSLVYGSEPLGSREGCLPFDEQIKRLFKYRDKACRVLCTKRRVR
ncbi:MAG: hypothetical protein QW158_07890 [Nitrososphaerales archaeon]